MDAPARQAVHRVQWFICIILHSAQEVKSRVAGGGATRRALTRANAQPSARADGRRNSAYISPPSPVLAARNPVPLTAHQRSRRRRQAKHSAQPSPDGATIAPAHQIARPPTPARSHTRTHSRRRPPHQRTRRRRAPTARGINPAPPLPRSARPPLMLPCPSLHAHHAQTQPCIAAPGQRSQPLHCQP